MPLSAVFGVFVALAAVLALLLVALRALQRFAPRAGGAGRGRLPLEVVQRVALGPKHGIAVVRIGDRVLAVSLGEGGVRTLAELEGDDRAAALAAAEPKPVPHASSAAALAALPGGAWLARRMTVPPSASRDASRDVATPAAPVPAAAPAGAEFRSVLGIAMSSSTRLAVLLAGALALGAPALRAQPAPVLAPLPTATQAALVQAALRQAPVPQPSQTLTPAAPRALTPPVVAPAAVAQPGRPVVARQPSTVPPGPRPLAGATSTAPPRQPLPPAPVAAPAAAGVPDPMVAQLAPTMDVRLGGAKGEGLRLSGTVGVVVMMGVLTLLPTLVLMMTGFTRILVVLQFLKQAIGAQTAPPNQLVAALALILTGFVMAPTLKEVNAVALQPWLEGRIEQVEMMQRGSAPLRAFMLRQVRERDLQTFVELSQPEVPPKTVDDVPLVVVMSAFVTSELRTAFQLGFALFLPFIIIDFVVSSVLMSMGMFMLPPAMIALPFKLLLFVLVDGWTLVIQSLVQSFR